MYKGKSIGGIRSVLYTMKIGRKVGFINMIKTLLSKNSCKTCALGMGGQHGGMVNEQGHWPEICKKSVQSMASDMQAPITENFFNKYSIKDLKNFSPRELEQSGRLNFPVFLNSRSKFNTNIIKSIDEIY